jgi:hypothetical protein
MPDVKAETRLEMGQLSGVDDVYDNLQEVLEGYRNQGDAPVR